MTAIAHRAESGHRLVNGTATIQPPAGESLTVFDLIKKADEGGFTLDVLLTARNLFSQPVPPSRTAIRGTFIETIRGVLNLTDLEASQRGLELYKDSRIPKNPDGTPKPGLTPAQLRAEGVDMPYVVRYVRFPDEYTPPIDVLMRRLKMLKVEKTQTDLSRYDEWVLSRFQRLTPAIEAEHARFSHPQPQSQTN